MEAAGRILILMQEGDDEHGFINAEWADRMFDSWSAVHEAVDALDRAKLAE